ncbi:MAG: coiled-coil domain-containing protein [Lachnospiraceae bacterium]
MKDIIHIEKKSLCMSHCDYARKKTLIRLGDIENGMIQLFVFQKDQMGYFEKRNKFLCKTGPFQEGKVGVWSWSADPRLDDSNRDYISKLVLSSEKPIEICELPDIRTESQLKNVIQDGISFEPCCDRMIISFSDGTGKHIGAYFTLNDLKVTDHKIKISEKINYLSLYVFSEEDILQTQYPQPPKFFMKKLDIGEPIRKIPLKSPMEIVKREILQRARRKGMKERGFSQNERKKFFDFIENITDETLYSDVAAGCVCSIQQAKIYVLEFIGLSNKYIESTDLDMQVLSQIVKNDDALRSDCQKLVEAEWKKENKILIDTKRKELEGIQQEIENQKNEKKKLDVSIKNAGTKMKNLDKSIEEKQALSNTIEKKVQEKIENARADVAEFISSMTFYNQPIVMNSGSKKQSLSVFQEGKEQYDEEIASWDLAIESIGEELEEAGIEKHSYSFGAFLYASYRNQAAVLLAGPNGESIAHAFSIGAFGKYAGILDCNHSFDQNSIEEMLNSLNEVIIIKNPFSADWINSIMGLLIPPKKFYILLCPFMDELQIESRGLVNYVMPVFTEMLIEEVPTENFVGKKRAENYEEYKITSRKTVQRGITNRLCRNSFSKNRLQQILADMHTMYDKTGSFEDYVYVLLPYAYLTNQVNVLGEEIEADRQLHNEEKQDLKTYLGMNE